MTQHVANKYFYNPSTSITEKVWHVLPQLIHMKLFLRNTSLGKITTYMAYDNLHCTYRKILLTYL